MSSAETNQHSTPETELEYVTEPSTDVLNYRELVDYNNYRKDLITWLAEEGKDVERKKGYAKTSVINYAARLDKFYRWAWESIGRYTTTITHEHADEYVDLLYMDRIRKKNGRTYSGNHKRKTTNAIEALFRWKANEKNGSEWACKRSFTEQTLSQADAFTRKERSKLREAALRYDSIPRYNDLTPEERDRWRSYLAQKLGKKKCNVSPEDWKQTNTSWEIPALINTSLDAGLRPIGIGRMSTDWFRKEKGVLYVPDEDLVKDGKSCEIALTKRTTKMLARWMNEREQYEKYDDTDTMWLNRKHNPHNSGTLNYLLKNLCEEAGISTDNRKITWYSIRHSLGTHLVSEGDLAQAKEQLRHKSVQSTMRYANPTAEERRSTLEGL